MDTIFECKFDQCGAIFSSSFSLSKHESVCQYKQGREFKLSDAYLSSLFTGADGPDKPVPAEEDNAHIDDNFENEYDASEYTPTNGNIELEELPSSSDDSFDIEYVADIIVRVSREASKRLAQELLTFLHAATLNANDYKTELPSLSTCKSIREKSVRDNLDGLNLKSSFVTYQSHHGPEEKHEFFMKNSVEVLRKQISLAEAQHVFTRPVLSDAGNDPSFQKVTQADVHPMHTTYSKQIYQSMRTEVLRSVEEDVFWNESLSEPMPCFVGMVQVYTDKTATTLKANATVAYPVHLVLLNFSKEFRRYLIDHGYTIVGLLPVSTSELSNAQEEVDLGLEKSLVPSSIVPLTDTLPATYSKDSRDVKLHILHDAMHQILQPLSLSSHRGFAVHVCERLWCCHPVIASYCCDTPEGKDMSSVKHGYSCIRCLTGKDDIAALHKGATRDPCKMECAYKASEASIGQCEKLFKKGKKKEARLKRDEARSILDKLSLYRRRCMLSKLSLTPMHWPNDQYSVFTVEPLHMLHLGISKKLKECTVSYLSSSEKPIIGVTWTKYSRKLSSYKFTLLNAANSLLAGYKNEFMVSDLRIDFSSAKKSGQLNGFFTSTGVKGMLEGKDYSAVDMVFPFIAAFIDRATGYSDEPKLTAVHTLYSDLVNYLMFKPCGMIGSRMSRYNLKENIQKLKEVAKEIFGNLEDINLFTLKFHMLDHVAEDESRFGQLNYLDASPYEHFNFVIKTFIRMTSMRKTSTLEETVKAMNSSASHDDIIEVKFDSDRRTVLARNGYEISLEGVSTSTHPNLTKLTKDGKQALARYVMEYARDEVSEEKRFSLPSDLKISIVKSGTICGGCNISLEDYDHDTNSIRKNIPIGSTRQRVFADESFGPAKAKRYSVVLVEGDDKCYWFARVLLLFHLETKTTLDPDKAEFAFVQYFDLTPPLDNVDTVLNCMCLRWATDDELDHSFNYDPSSSGTIEVGEWYGLVPFSSVISVHHILRSNYCIPPFSPQLPWPVHRFYVNRFYQSRQLASTEGKKI